MMGFAALNPSYDSGAWVHTVANSARRANQFCLSKLSQAPKSLIFRFTRILFCGINTRSAPTEGRFAVVTKRWARDAMDAVASGALHRTKTPAADGEVVWSWRRDPGVKPMERSVGDGGKKGRFPGESTKETVKPLRGESRDVSAVPVKSVCILSLPSHTVLRAQSAPGFPCALSMEGGTTKMQNPGENEPRE
jgi:hypothetical protein